MAGIWRTSWNGEGQWCVSRKHWALRRWRTTVRRGVPSLFGTTIIWLDQVVGVSWEFCDDVFVQCLHLSLLLPVLFNDVGLGWRYGKHKERHLLLSKYFWKSWTLIERWSCKLLLQELFEVWNIIFCCRVW